ncbi:MAG TPA: S41 family peptidase, partial [Gemmatimonadales bacterium]|nr:S41 family peptidase [Gemmatimonadales bacterium]
AWPDLGLVLLVNGSTASASELMAAALKDHGRATIVGAPTFGKGVIQTTFPLGEEVAVKFTTARWYSPDGYSIQRPDSTSGVIPDVPVRGGLMISQRALDRALGRDAELFNAVVAAYVTNLRAAGSGVVLNATVTPGMVSELWTQFEAAGASMTRASYTRIGGRVRERIRSEIVRQMWGEEAALRTELEDDRYVTTAMQVLTARGRSAR